MNRELKCLSVDEHVAYLQRSGYIRYIIFAITHQAVHQKGIDSVDQPLSQTMIGNGLITFVDFLHDLLRRQLFITVDEFEQFQFFAVAGNFIQMLRKQTSFISFEVRDVE